MRTTYLKLALSICFTAVYIQVQAQFGAVHLFRNNSLSGDRHLVADMDQDGDQDILVLQSGGKHDLLLFRNGGDGNYDAPEVLLKNVAQELYLVDFNHDGKPDILAKLQNGTTLWSPNNGDGTFTNFVPILPEGTIYSYITKLVDFDFDGETDLVYENWNGSFYQYFWMKNEGWGIFVNSYFLLDKPGVFSLNVDLADFNNDGRMDFLMSQSQSTGLLQWYPQKTNGQMGLAQVIDTQAYSHYEVHTTDVDRDGNQDIIGNIFKPNGLTDVRWFRNDGLGHFAAPVTIAPNISYGYYPDYNHDGYLDVSAVDSAGLNYTIYLNIGGGGFGTQSVSPLYLDITAIPADINGDGLDDFVVMNGSGLFTSLGEGNGDFGAVSSFYPDIPAFATVLPADADHDGDVDVFYTTTGKYAEIGWLRNDGATDFSDQRNIIAQQSCNFYSNAFAQFQVADLNGDHYPEVMAVDWCDSLVLVWKGQPGGTGFGIPDTLFKAPDLTFIHSVVDIDADGDFDLLVYQNPGPNLIIYKGWMLNDGTGHFSAPVPGLQFGPTDYVDLNVDGLPDILNVGQHELLWYANTGGGTFGPEQILYATSSYAPYPTPADIDHDGDVDFMIRAVLPIYPYDQFTFWIENKGVGASWVERNIGGSREFSALADLDQDNFPDMCDSRRLISSDTFTSIFWYPNNGTGVFGAKKLVGTRPESNYIIPIDMEHDGDHDVLFYGSHEIGWFENFGNDPIIKGRCFLDTDADGHFDNTESPAAGLKIRLEPDGKITYTDQAGYFSFYTNAGNKTLEAETADCLNQSTDSLVFHVQIPSVNGDSLFLFGFKNTGTQPQMTASVASGPTRCGFLTPFWITLKNEGCSPARGRIALKKDPLVSFVSAVPVPLSVQGDSIVWLSADSLQAGETRSIKALFTVAGADHLGETIHLNGTVYALNATGNPSQAFAMDPYASVVNCAFDPNEKLVNRSQVPIDYSPEQAPLLYTIRFQNTGTDTAFTVKIVDKLDAGLDWSSFKPLAGSHPYKVTIDEFNGDLEFVFDQIMLPDSNRNETGSHGFVTFSILLKSGLAPSYSVLNKAAIYFDFNPPIFTNTVTTDVERPVSTETLSNPSETMTVTPNPNNGTFYILLDQPAEADMQLQVFDLNGRLLAQQRAEPARKQEMELRLPAGVYVLQLWGNNGIVGKTRFVKM